MSVTVASEQTKQQKESGSVTKSANLQWREKQRKRANGGRAVRGRYRPLRRSGVNGTAKVYFVEEKAACHATMGPRGGDVGVPRGPRDHGDCRPPRGRRGRVCVYEETGGEGR